MKSKNARVQETWSKKSWREFAAEQQPLWPNVDDYEVVLDELSCLPALVFAGETRALRQELASAGEGKAFVLQCGDCAESFSRCTGPRIHALIKVMLQMSVILAYAGEKRIVNIARLAGQYAKPRSSDTERVGEVMLPVYRGDMVNSADADLESRTPNPARILDGYFRATATLNLLRAFTSGGYAALNMADSWHRDFTGDFPLSRQYTEMVKGIRKSLRFAKAVGLDLEVPQLKQVNVFTSHEALLLGYEEAMTRIDTTTGLWYDTSAHFLWIGDRTRQLNGAHIEYVRGICNPVGLKIGPDHKVDEIKRVVESLNPDNELGRLTLITRFGVEKVANKLPRLIRGIKEEGFHVVWLCDPMHGNTYKNRHSQKIRYIKDISKETTQFFQIGRSEGIKPGGIHLELTGDSVTECIGTDQCSQDFCLQDNYESNCDPRLNAEQSVEFAFEVADLLQNDK
ncbi:MAG: 3-deoxy-7-phosphoheptulonate synthase [Verrucomicrobiae bacterium]|nr:3-deoxy-7-phosphoheptulonate synthase [Verrucomicrobiae bacterium]